MASPGAARRPRTGAGKQSRCNGDSTSAKSALPRQRERRADRCQSLQGPQDLRLVVCEMTHEDVGVPDVPVAPELLDDFVDRSGNEGFPGNAAITLAQRV